MERGEMRGAAWTREEDDRLRKLWSDVSSVEMLTKHFPGRTRNALLGRAFRLKLPCKLTLVNEEPTPKRRGRPIGAYGQWHQEALALRQKGWLFREIAARFDVSTSAVHRAIDPVSKELARDHSREYRQQKYGADEEWTERQRAAFRRWKERQKEARA